MHEKSIISRQVIEDHVVCPQLMKQKEKKYRIMISVNQSKPVLKTRI